jgi:hypothetical protein
VELFRRLQHATATAPVHASSVVVSSSNTRSSHVRLAALGSGAWGVPWFWPPWWRG